MKSGMPMGSDQAYLVIKLVFMNESVDLFSYIMPIVSMQQHIVHGVQINSVGKPVLPFRGIGITGTVSDLISPFTGGFLQFGENQVHPIQRTAAHYTNYPIQHDILI